MNTTGAICEAKIDTKKKPKKAPKPLQQIKEERQRKAPLAAAAGCVNHPHAQGFFQSQARIK